MNNVTTLRFCLLLMIGLLLSNQDIAIARVNKPVKAKCYFFQAEKLMILQTCLYQISTWTGGGGSTLKWQDGVVTQMQFGLQGRGSLVCPEGKTRVDGFCAATYSRDPSTLRRLPSEVNNLHRANDMLSCVQVRRGSICWITLENPFN